jgi:hypothetical protein
MEKMLKVWEGHHRLAVSSWTEREHPSLLWLKMMKKEEQEGVPCEEKQKRQKKTLATMMAVKVQGPLAPLGVVVAVQEGEGDELEVVAMQAYPRWIRTLKKNHLHPSPNLKHLEGSLLHLHASWLPQLGVAHLREAS